MLTDPFAFPSTSSVSLPLTRRILEPPDLLSSEEGQTFLPPLPFLLARKGGKEGSPYPRRNVTLSKSLLRRRAILEAILCQTLPPPSSEDRL